LHRGWQHAEEKQAHRDIGRDEAADGVNHGQADQRKQQERAEENQHLQAPMRHPLPDRLGCKPRAIEEEQQRDRDRDRRIGHRHAAAMGRKQRRHADRADQQQQVGVDQGAQLAHGLVLVENV
jgi:hypothetical protein